MKRFLPYIPFVLLLIVSVVSVGFSESHKNAQKCGDVVIAIDKGWLEKEFVQESDIYACINLKKEDIVGKKNFYLIASCYRRKNRGTSLYLFLCLLF
jgi:hypothetical protein